MFVSRLDKNEFLSDLVTELQAPVGQLSQQSRALQGTSRKGKTTQKTTGGGTNARNLSGKDVFQKKGYTEEAIEKDGRLNIYTGNPGYYTTAGDTVYFGTATTLSDSAFLQGLRPVIPTTIKPYGIVGKERIVPGQDWVLGFILILWMIFASVRVEFPEYLGQIFSGLVNFNAAARLFRQRGYKTMFGAVRLDLIFYFTLPLSLFQIAQFFKVDIPGFPSIVLFIAILLIINLYFFIKILIHRLVGSIAMLKDQTDEIIFNIRLYYRVLGFILMPIATVHAILPETNFITIWGMGILIIIMYIAALVRSIYLGYQKDISIFYLILYLCTLEILPLLLIFKLVMRQ